MTSLSTSYLRLLFFALLCMSTSPAWAQAPISDSDSDIDIEDKRPQGDFWKYHELDENEHADPVTESFEYVLNTSHRFANWVDGFFDDDRTVGIKNTTRLKISAWVFYDNDDSYDDSDFNFNLRVKLPRTQKRVQFIITNDTEEDLSSSRAGGVFPDQQKSDETTVGFRFFDLAGLSKKIPGDFSTAIGVGFSSYSPTLKIEPRYLYTHDFKIWSTTFLQKIRWHSEDGWKTETRLDFDRALSEKYFLRFNNELYWEEDQEDYEGLEFRPRVLLSRRFSTKQALVYEWNNIFYTEPSFDLNATALVVRYRRQFWRPWLFGEVAPQVAFREEDDWNASPGIFAKLEILMQKTDK